MDLNEYQRQAMTFSILPSNQDSVTYGLLNIPSEAGEITGKHAKSLRDSVPLDHEELKKEVGDLLWSIASYVDGMGWDLNEIAINNLEKLKSRTERGVIHGSGDNR